MNGAAALRVVMVLSSMQLNFSSGPCARLRDFKGMLYKAVQKTMKRRELQGPGSMANEVSKMLALVRGHLRRDWPVVRRAVRA
eukprot:3019849-Pyramimonas_sp.AAC.1